MPISRSTSHSGRLRSVAPSMAARISAPGSMPYCSAMRRWNEDNASDANTIPALPVRITWNRSSLLSASGSRMPTARDSHSSIAIASNASRSISLRTAATEARDTCAVPSTTYSTPLRSTRASGCSWSGSSWEGSICAFKRGSLQFRLSWAQARRAAVEGQCVSTPLAARAEPVLSLSKGSTRTEPCILISIAKALQQVAIRVDPAVAQERPDAAHVLAAGHVQFDNHQFALVAGSLRQDFALRAGDETGTPELQAAAAVGRFLETDAIARCERHAVGDRVPALHGDPRVALACFLFLVVGRIPADRGRVQQDFRAGQRHQPRGLRVPLVPAHQHAELAERSLDRMEAEVARCEVELLVVGRIVGDVHLAIHAGDSGRAIEHHRGVVVQTRGSVFEQRGDHHQLQFLRELAEALGGRAGNGFAAVEFAHVFVLAEVRAVVQFLQQHQLRAGLRGFAHARLDRIEIGVGAAAIALLQEGEFEGFVRHRTCSLASHHKHRHSGRRAAAIRNPEPLSRIGKSHWIPGSGLWPAPE